MTQTDIKPWSQVDDELEEFDGACTPKKNGAESVERAAARRSRGTKTSGRLGFMPHWLFVPLGAAAAWTSFAAFLGGDDALPLKHFLGIILCLATAAVILLLIIRSRKAAMDELKSAIVSGIGRMANDPGGVTDSEDLQPLYAAMQKHTANIERRVAELLEQHKQLSLELSMAQTHRRNAEAIIDSIAEPVLVTDPFDQLIVANPAAAELLKFDRTEALRKEITTFIENPAVVRAIRAAREADTRASHRKVELQSGSQVYALKLAPFTTEDAADATSGHGVVSVFRNVTREREAAKNKSEFVAHAAHELRTPLSSIRAYVEMLVDGEAEDEKTLKEYYDIIQVSAERLGRMIDNILNISRIEAGTVRISREPVAFAMIVKEAIDVARPQAEKKQITLTQELASLIYRINADRDMVYQAVLNLLSNAIKYTPEGGKVDVRMTAREDNNTIVLDVADTGVGIPQEDLPKMFQKFFRVEANKQVAKGTGLGLNLVKHIVETVHEGQVTLQSDVGKGSTFGMILPLTK